MQGIRENTSWEMHILLHRGGPLENQFKSFGPTTILKPAGYSKEKNILKKIRMRSGMAVKKRKLLFNKKQYDFVFNNTIANGSLLNIFSKKNIPVLTYVHELESVIKIFSSKGEAQETFRYTDLFISPSALVKNNLVKNHSIQPGKIFILPYYFPGYETPHAPANKALQRSSFLTKYNIPGNKFLVLAMGTANLRKGIDYFVEICKLVKTAKTNIHFVWIGSFTDKQLEEKIRLKITSYELEEDLTIIDDMPFHKNNLLPADVFLLPSREDPYPLVVLDAAFLKIPTIAFAGSGGAAEFINKKNGWLAEDFSLTKFAEKIVQLHQRPEEIVTAGTNAFEHAIYVHGNAKNFITRLNDIVTEIKNNR